MMVRLCCFAASASAASTSGRHTIGDGCARLDFLQPETSAHDTTTSRTAALRILPSLTAAPLRLFPRSREKCEKRERREPVLAHVVAGDVRQARLEMGLRGLFDRLT